MLYSLNYANPDYGSQVVWEDGERVFSRGWMLGNDGRRRAVLTVALAAEPPPAAAVDRLAHEYELRDVLDAAWAAHPLAFSHAGCRTALLLADPGGEPLERLIGAPMDTARFLPLAIGIVGALGSAHQRGLVHRDVKPANLLVNCPDGQTRLIGFGIASRLLFERQAPEPPGVIAGTLAYMAPEQSGRMNRSVDCRSDLYSLGVTFYQMLTGRLPFRAADPTEWVHCHIARAPTAPADCLDSIPTPISDIVMKLLAKTAEDRYQIAAGVELDLKRCLSEWERHGRIESFALGERDRPDRLMIAEKLYGREREVKSLLAAFRRVVKGDAPELVLVSGHSGVGKTSVVNELQKALAPAGGMFAFGKVDQLKRDVPYSTIAQAIGGLVRSLLGASDAELARWRDALVKELGPNGRLMTDIVPDLKLVIGLQPPVPEIEPQRALARFHLAFRRFIGVFAAERPLALFLDDLQWLDGATLDLIADLLTQVDVRRLLLVGAYRDNEVDADHPLMRKLDAIKAGGGKVTEIKIAPLKPKHLGRLIADALRCETTRAEPLAQLVHEKTGGNPFFGTRFLYSLADDGLLKFDHDVWSWLWNVEGIRAKAYTDNVSDLMLGKLARLPEETRGILQQMACLGSVVEFPKLAIIRETPEDDVHAAMWEALEADLVARLPRAYRFVHDRVQEAAYSLLPETQQAAAHLRIGRLLAARMPSEERENAIFEIVNHLNRGAALMRDPDERARLAGLNLIAGKRAKASTAYNSALAYFIAGIASLPEESWKRHRDLAFALELGWAECEFLTGALAEAEQHLADLVSRALSVPDLAAVARLRQDLFMTLGRSDRAVGVCLDFLRRIDIAWPVHPTKEDVRQEYERIWLQIGSRSIEELLDLRTMTDPEWGATMDVLAKAVTPARFIDANLHCLIVGRMVNLSLEHGNSDASCYGYALGGAIFGSKFGDYNVCSRFGKLALDLVEQRGLVRLEAGVYLVLAIDVNPWTRPIHSNARNLIQRAFNAAERRGDRTFEGYSCAIRIFDLIAAGDPLGDAQREAESMLALVQKRNFSLQVDIIAPPLQFIRTLRGHTPTFGSFDDAEFNEGQFERYLKADRRLAVAACLYWIRKLQALVFANEYASALAAAAEAERHLWTSETFFQFAEFHLYAALARAATCDRAIGEARARHLEALTAHHRRLQKWAANCTENFENRAALVAAEIARLEGRETDAERLYEQAIRSARANGFVHNEAIAYESAARFYEARGFEEFAHVYLRKARDGYLRWGADGKVKQLEERFTHLRVKDILPAPTVMIHAPVESLDLATVIKVSQAVSGEIVLEKLLETLMRTAIEYAGADRALLIATRGDELRVEAEATTSGEEVKVHQPDGPHASPIMPESLIRYVMRTKENVVLDDASAGNSLAVDRYLALHPSRSILCLPLINQAKVTGVLLLENRRTPRVFAHARVSVLTLLASHAAIALENARLYREVEEREKQQAATSKMLRVISNSPIQSVLDAVAENAARLSNAGNAEIFRLEDNLLRLVASYGDIPLVIHAHQGIAANRDTVTGRAACDRRTIHVHDLAAEEDEYPVGSSNAKREGHRTTLGTPLLREDVPVGIILVRRREVRPFSDEEIALIETFADHAVIAIENARLFEAEKQRALALARANRNLEDRERKIRRLVESNIIGVFFGDFEGRILEANDAFLRIIGYDRADLTTGGINWNDLTPGDWRDRDAQWIDEHKRTGVRLPIEKEFSRKDGGRVPVLLGSATFEEGGNHSVTFVVDLTERKQAEVALQESEAKFRDYAETASDWFWEIDAEYKFTLLTENAFGSNQSDRIGANCWDHALDVESEPEKWRLIRATLDSQMPFRDFIYLAKAGSGAPIYVKASGKPVFDGAGTFRGYRGTGADVTKSIRAQEEHERLQRLEAELAHMNRISVMGELTASLAHEITHPIATARNNARAALNFLDRQPPDLGEVREALTCAVADADRAGIIIDRMRDHIRKAPARKDRFDLNEAIDEVIMLARSAIARSNISVQTRMTNRVALVEGDRVQLQQVMLNLILNAIEAMSGVAEGGRALSIDTEHRRNEVVVTVRDSGPGVDPDHIKRIFDTFYTTKSSGVGMGLSICRSIVDAHGGRLWADANEPRGAIFRFAIPSPE